MNNASRLLLQRAKSALQLGKITKTEEIWYEDLCFQLQQAAEKALKGYLIFLGVDPPRTHSFNIILQELGKYIQYPVELEEVLNLNDYAVQARYPGEYTPIEEEEYEEAGREPKIAFWNALLLSSTGILYLKLYLLILRGSSSLRLTDPSGG